MKRILAIAALSAALSVIATGQQPQPTFHDELLDHMQGSWVLQGKIGSKETTHDITVDWIVEHQYLRIHEVSRDKNAKGEPGYEAMVFIGWDQATSRYVAVWLDVWGGVSKQTVGYAARSGDDIPFFFTDGSSGIHTTFAYDRKANAWGWIMDNDEAGKLTPFARAKMTKVSAAN